MTTWRLALAAALVAAQSLSGQTRGSGSNSDGPLVPICQAIDPPKFRLGSIDGDGLGAFDGVSDATFTASGGIAVLSRYSGQVILFESDGAYSGTLGRRGEGPGEFADPIEVSPVDGDSIAVWDWRLGRITVFPLESGVPRIVRLDPPVLSPTGHFGVLRGEPTSFVVSGQSFTSPGRGGRGGNETLHVLRYDILGALLDTIASVPYGQRLWVDEGRREAGRPWFEARGTFGLADDELFFSDGSAPEVWSVRPPNQPTLRLRWDDSQRNVTTADVRVARAKMFESIAPQLRDRLSRAWDVLPVADVFPALDQILGNPSGDIWIREYVKPSAAESRWLHFDSSGQIRCILAFGDDFRPRSFHDSLVLGVIKGEYDVEFVEVRSIVR